MKREEQCSLYASVVWHALSHCVRRPSTMLRNTSHAHKVVCAHRKHQKREHASDARRVVRQHRQRRREDAMQLQSSVTKTPCQSLALDHLSRKTYASKSTTTRQKSQGRLATKQSGGIVCSTTRSMFAMLCLVRGLPEHCNFRSTMNGAHVDRHVTSFLSKKGVSQIGRLPMTPPLPDLNRSTCCAALLPACSKALRQ